MRVRFPKINTSHIQETSDALKRYYAIRFSIGKEVAPFALTIDETPTPYNTVTRRDMPIIRKEKRA